MMGVVKNDTSIRILSCFFLTYFSLLCAKVKAASKYVDVPVSDSLLC